METPPVPHDRAPASRPRWTGSVMAALGTLGLIQACASTAERASSALRAPSSLTITAIGTADAAPDMTKVIVTVTTRARTARWSAALAARRERTLTQLLLTIGIGPESIWSTDYGTRAVSLMATPSSDSLLAPDLALPTLGTEVHHTLEIAVADMTKTGVVLDALQTVPNLTVDRVTTYPRDLGPATLRATDAALEQATSQATTFATRAGATVARFVSADASPMTPDSLIVPHGARHIVRVRLSTTWLLTPATAPSANARPSPTAPTADRGTIPSLPAQKPTADTTPLHAPPPTR